MSEDDIRVEAVEAPKLAGTMEQFKAFMANLDRPTEEGAKAMEQLNARIMRASRYGQASTAVYDFVRSISDEARAAIKVGDVIEVGSFTVEVADIRVNAVDNPHFSFRLCEA